MKLLKIIKSALWKAIAACFLFILSYTFYDIELIRANVEDIAFDVVNKIAFFNRPQNTKHGQVMLFAFDDAYMRSQGLYDDKNRGNYGYLFPRERIAQFIKDLDELVSEVEVDNRPKAVFIDYDMSFTSLPYGKLFSKDDEELLNLLKKNRPYKILLPKTSIHNFIQENDDAELQAAIKNQRIIFVSVPLLVSNDNVVRRYQGFKEFNQLDYPNAEVTLWKMISNDKLAVDKAFFKGDTIANRIWMKSYDTVEEDGDCIIHRSYWNQLSKYSVNCSLFDIAEEDFSGSVLMLGGTHRQNGDTFNVNPLSLINVSSADMFSGLDIHGNALMTMLHLDGVMQRLPLWLGLVIVFFSFIVISLLASMLFALFRLNNASTELLLMLALTSTLLISISIYLLKEHQLWFNWFIPLILIQLIESFNLFQIFTRKIFRRQNA